MAELENAVQNILDDPFEADDVNTLLMASVSDIEDTCLEKGEEPDYIIEKALGIQSMSIARSIKK